MSTRADGRHPGEPIDPAWWNTQPKRVRRDLRHLHRWLLEQALGVPDAIRSGVEWDQLAAPEKARRRQLVEAHPEYS